jgi:hypothetical protein
MVLMIIKREEEALYLACGDTCVIFHLSHFNANYKQKKKTLVINLPLFCKQQNINI